MRLKSVRVTNYRSVVDSGPVEFASVTCLVGKNESGKTSFLSALEQLNPSRTDGQRDIGVVRDYPRWALGEAEAAMTAGNPPRVLEAKYVLTDEERLEFNATFGSETLTSSTIESVVDYEGTRIFRFSTNEGAAVRHLVEQLGNPENLSAVTTVSAFQAATADLNDDPESGMAKDRAQALSGWSHSDNLRASVSSWIRQREPTFLYFGEYDMMPGRVSIPALVARRANGQLTPEDRTFLALLDIANVTPESFQDDAHYDQQKARLEAAGLRITQELFEFWQQNKDSSIEFDKSAADQSAGGELAQGINLHVRAKGRRNVTVPIDQGSHGFRWFFSFLVYFTRIRDHIGDRPLVLLLDEPGGVLHALAQADFLRVVDERLAPIAQVIYTTHSPFMVDAGKLERVRLVTDDPDHGTIVSNEVLRIDGDTLFPLQAALGYSIGQTLFVAPHALLVEGPSDMLYLQAWSRALADAGRTTLDPRWVIVPVGGVSKIETFVRLYGANQLHTAVLLDGTKQHDRDTERLHTAGLEPSQVVSVADALDEDVRDADIEDLFPSDFYVQLVKAAYPNTQAAALTGEAVDTPGNPRLAKRVQTLLESWNFTSYDHLKPALELSSGNSGPYTIPPETLDRAELLFGLLNASLGDARAAPKATKPRVAKSPVK